MAKSYDEARAECIRDVDRIIKECRRTNQKYRDLHFDIEWDLKSGQRNCLDGLRNSHNEMKPKGVKRVTDIFEKPEFYINGATAGDVRQGRTGDCFFMAALCGLGNMEGLIHKICVKHDQQVGVYGFVFHRDGEWQQTIVDDKLYLKAPDYDEAQDERVVWDDINRVDSEEEYRKAHQTGSRALYFAQCSDENETWLPLLEKAYAKAHGDYGAIDGGFTGEAVEDLTGGVTTEIYSTDILDKEAFWRDELMHVNKEFLFGCATGFYSNWLDPTGKNDDRDLNGIDTGHAYSIMEARELKGKRLLKVRNPWGKREWQGKWSDGSAEWDAEWMQLLDHKFGNDGVFWISYEDLLKKYQHFDRTRIFDNEWNVSQAWLSLDIGWSPEYHSTRFLLTVKEKGPVVIVLSQLDDTYFDGLQGCYAFDLQFRLEEAKEEGNPDDYIVRSNGAYAMARSVSTDIELEAGTYVVLMKITATRQNNDSAVEDLLNDKYVESRRNKLIQIGLSYDLAHAKGVYVEGKEEKKERKRKEEERKQEEKARTKRKMRERAEKDWQKNKMRHDREKERRAKRKKRGSVDRDGDLDKSRQGSGSLDAQPAASAVDGDGINERKPDAERVQHNGAHEDALPVRIKSFSGENVETGKSQEESRAVPPPPPPTRQMTNEGTMDSSEETANPEADGVVQSIDEAVKAADEETKAKKTDVSPISTKHSTAEAEEKPPTPIIQVNGKDAVTDVKPLPNLPPLSTPEHTLPSQPSQPNGAETKHPSGLQRQDTFESTARNGTFRPNSDLDDNASIDSFPSFDWNSDLDIPTDYDSTSSSSSDDSSDSDEDSKAGLFSIDPGDPPRPTSSHSRSSSSTSSGGSIMYKPPIEPSRRDRYRRRRRLRDDRGSLPPPPGEGALDGKDEGEEPWNAVCVVGLRVYSRKGGKEGVELKVVWGENEEEERKRKAKKERRKKRKGKAKGLKGIAGGEEKEVEEIMSPNIKLDPDDPSKGQLSLSSSLVDVRASGEAAGAGNDSAITETVADEC